MRKRIICFLMIIAVTTRVDAKSVVAQLNQKLQEQEQLFQVEKIINPEEILALDDYFVIGMRNNPQIRKSFYEWKASVRRISQAFSLPDPQFSYTNYLKEVETRVGPQKQAFSLTQKLPLPDKIWLKKSKAIKAAEAAYYQFQSQRQNLIYQIANAYYEYAYLGRAILLTQENMKLLKNFENVIQTKYKSGLAENHDLLKIQVELGQLENDLYSQESLRVALTSRLGALLNLSIETVLPWPKEMLEEITLEDQFENIKNLKAVLSERSPQLLEQQQNVRQNQDGVKLAKREFFPDLTVGITQIKTDDAMNAGVVDSGKDPLLLMFSVNVPIWANRLKAGVDEAKAMEQAAEQSLLNKENELSAKLEFVHYQLKDAYRQSQMYRQALIPKAEQSLNAIQSGYESGKVDFLSLIESQRVLLNFQLAFYRQNASFHQRLSELKMLLGEEDNLDISLNQGDGK